MQTIQKLHRSNYTGETIVTDLRWEATKWVETKEFIPNSVSNNNISKRAVVIGNGDSRKNFDLNFVKNHKRGNSISSLQSYGCNALYRDFAPTFLVAVGNEMCNELAESDYCDEHIVYANAQYVSTHPGKFYLIPQDPAWNAGTLALYMACFDGHETVYMIGFDGEAGAGLNNNVYAGTPGYQPMDHGYSEAFWVKSMIHIMETYPDVDFVRVMPTPNWRIPEGLKGVINLRHITTNQFAIEADL
jgi:hypothetical protein